MTLPIVYTDEHLLVLDKPTGVSFLRERDSADCLWDRIVEHCRVFQLPRPLQVHRLDKGTSGVLLIALTPECQKSLSRQFNLGSVVKCYVGRVAGGVQPRRGIIDLPLRPGRKSRFRVAGLREDIGLDESEFPHVWRLYKWRDQREKRAFDSRTSYRVLQSDKHSALLSIRLYTGRSHQVRVHLSWVGYPVLGDHLYGKPDDPAQQAPRLMLHCRKLVVESDWTARGQRLVFRAPVPDSFTSEAQ